MSKTLPDYNSLVRWTVNDVCLWLMENGFSNFVRNFREGGIDGSRLADLSNQDLQKMRCPFNKQSELLRCVKAIERKEPSRPQGVQNIVNRPPPKQPEPPKKDYRAPPQEPANGFDSDDDGSGPDDDYEWPQSDFSDSDQDYENDTANEVHQNEPMTKHSHQGHHHGHHHTPAAHQTPDSDSEGSYEEPTGPHPSRPGPSHGQRPPPPLPTQQKNASKPPLIQRRVPPPPKEDDQPVYEDPDEEQRPQEIPSRVIQKPPIVNRRPPVEVPPVEETQDVYEDPDNPPQTQLSAPSNKSQHNTPTIPRRQPPPIPVQSQTSIPDHRAPPLPPNAQSKLAKRPQQVEVQDVYEIPNEAPSSPDQPAYLDMQKPQNKVEEQDVYEVPDPEEDKTPQKTTHKPKVAGGVSILPGVTASQIKKGPLKEEKPPNRPLPKQPQNKTPEKHIPVPKPPGRKDAPAKKEALARPLPTPPPNDNLDDDEASGEENISSFPWYHPIERSVADKRLTEHGATGVFLIRNSSKANQPYTLALLYEGKVYNLPIRRRDDNKFAMGSAKRNEQGFDKVSQLVEFFTTHTLILAGTTTGVRLKIPLPK